MGKIVTLYEKNLFINFSDLAERQKLIWEKYDNPKIFLIKCGKENEFISNLDRYLLNIIEEISETHDVVFVPDNETVMKNIFNKEFNKDELLEEIVDIFNYSATTLSILSTAIGDNYDLNKMINFLSTSYSEVIDLKEDVNKYLNKDFANDLCSILDQVIYLRRLFPERKWHKPSPKYTKQENLERITTSIKYITNAMFIAIQVMVNITGGCIKEINEIIDKKFEFIKDLKPLEAPKEIQIISESEENN